MSIHQLPRYAFYAETCFHRTEHFLHDQLSGLEGAVVTAYARWGANLEEFPVSRLRLVEEFRDPASRLCNAVRRRVMPARADFGRLPGYAARSLARGLRRDGVDLAYCLFGWHATQMLDVLDRLPRRLPFVFLAGGSDVTAACSLGEGYLERLRIAFDRAAAILCGSEFLRGRLIALGAPDAKVRTHYIGIEIPRHLPDRSKSEPRPLRAVAVSRLSAVKGVHHTIRAFARASSQIPGAALDILGDGEDRASCEALIDELDARDRIRLLGSRRLGEVHRAMEEADVFLQHNVRTPEGREESLGGSILEASARGLPVIATRSGGVPEAVEHGQTGLLVESGDEDGMAAAILRIANAPREATAFGAAGRALVERKFELCVQNRRLADILKAAAMETPR